LVRAELETLGVEVIWFDTDDYRIGTDLTFGIEGGVPNVHLRIGAREQRGDTVAAVLYRHVRLPVAPQIADPEARRMAESEMRWALEGSLLALQPALWANHPHANNLARSKLLQLRLATGLGFTVPDTRVTADPQDIRRHYKAWNGRMVAKLVGGQIVGHSVDSQYVVHTTAISEADLQNDEALSACPAIYQRLIDKRYDLRVTVVGDEVFACRIDSQQHAAARIDWRSAGYNALDIQRCDLEASVAKRCFALLRALNLEIAGIDLIVTPEGDTVFLEINAAGQWAWVQEATGLPIATSIARRLAAARDANFLATYAP
jgi:glutathione synthase/RimK-type ligase-like ATP-grasp enzyme